MLIFNTFIIVIDTVMTGKLQWPSDGAVCWNVLLLLLTDATGYSPVSPAYECDDDDAYEPVIIPWSSSEPVWRCSTPIVITSSSSSSTLSDVDQDTDEDEHDYHDDDHQHHSGDDEMTMILISDYDDDDERWCLRWRWSRFWTDYCLVVCK